MKKYLIPILILIAAAWVYADDPFAPGGSMLGTALTGVVLDSEIDSVGELETVSNGGAFMSDMLAATSAANARSINGSQQVWITQSLTSNADPYTIVPSAGENIRILLTTHQAAVSLVLSETNAADMKTVVIINVASDAADMADNDTVSELTSPLVLAQHESITFKYHTDRYIEESRATNAFSAASISIGPGTILGGVKIVTTTDGSETAAAADLYGTIYVADNATAANDTDYTLPGAVAGMSACFYDFGAGDGGVIVDPEDSDVIWFNGTALTAGYALDSPGVAGAGPDGNFICMVALDITNWVVTGWSGTWVDGGAN